MGSARREREHLLPFHASPVAHTRLVSHDAAPPWPSTFEEGLDARLPSPVSLTPRRRSFLSASPYTERQRRGPHDAGPSCSRLNHAPTVVHGTSSFHDALLNAINVLMGVGVLSCPFSLRSSGVLVGTLLFLFFSLVTNHTGKLLGKCLDYQDGMTTYPDIGEAAFGTKGRVIIGLTFFSELFTACAMFFVLIGDTLAALLPSYTKTHLTIVVFFLIMPTMWTTNMSILSYFSILGILSSLFCLSVVLYVGVVMEPSASSPDTMGSLLHPQPLQVIGDLDRIPLAIGLTMVAFGGHSVFPSICSSMANKREYPRVLDRSYVIVGLVYATIALAGYLMYGTATQKEITLNLIATYPGVLTRLMIWMIALNPMSKIAITLHPVALALEECLLSGKQKRAVARHRPGKGLVCFRAVLRTVLGTTALCCALFVPYFARVTSFIGAFFSTLVSAIFPCMCYLKLFGHRISKMEVVLNAGLIGLSTLLMVVGTLASFLSPAE
ncbi:hypothetical protein PsorP6_007218 [Peronosclerospora sorghi]|uniref:Uncharacterized protein n=1 Tax=Peronosclerospora sorghi TaxID=230839 RepID=A0ACC0W9B8_9STRA|nr:hypothetical protein PsorP6_007218 [Peronosclerospora sorghi]